MNFSLEYIKGLLQKGDIGFDNVVPTALKPAHKKQFYSEN